MEIRINLSSKPYLNRQSVRLWLLVVCAVTALLLILNLVFAYQNIRQLGRLDSRMQELAGQVSGPSGTASGYSAEKLAALRSEIARDNDIVAADQFRWTRLLGRFEELLPAEVSIRSIQPDFKDRSVQLSCVARDVTAMTQFVDQLLHSEDLNQAYLLRHGDVESKAAGMASIQTGFSLVIREAF